MRVSAVSLACLLISGFAAARAVGQEPESAKEERKARLEFIKAKAAEFELFADDDRDKPLKLHDEPLLRYSNPVSVSLSEGATFLWLDGTRPVAAAAWSIRTPGNAFREFASLTERPMSCQRKARVVWSPRTGGLLDQAFPGSPVPADTAARRLTQMRSLARQFVVESLRDDQSTELRLLTQPIYRFEDKSRAVVEGGLFSFSEATDPEMLLLLEARRVTDSKEHQWRFTLARMTSRVLRVRLSDKEVWSVPGYWKGPRSPNDPYVEAPEGAYSPPVDPPATKNAAPDK